MWRVHQLKMWNADGGVRNLSGSRSKSCPRTSRIQSWQEDSAVWLEGKRKLPKTSFWWTNRRKRFTPNNMKACPTCDSWNEKAATHCKQCGAEFEPPRAVDPQLTDPADALVIVATFGDVVEASLLKDQLESAGIPACIPEELNPSPFGNMVPMAQVTVQVAAKDYEAAKEILKSEG
jgi:hypothetical protein